MVELLIPRIKRLFHPEGAPAAIGPYRVLQGLSGGSFRSYRAEEPATRKEVLIRMLPPGSRVVEEARAAVGIEHPNLIGVLHVAGGVEPYVVSEAPEGVTLDTKLRREQKLKVLEAIRIAWAIASGLSCLHGRGLVHRGVNPASIWIGPGKRIRLADVGLTPPSEDSLLDALTQPAGIPGF